MQHPFNLQAPFKPSPDQARAIDEILQNFANPDRPQTPTDFQPLGGSDKSLQRMQTGKGNNKPKQTLLGVTGSGKTFVMANVISEMKRPTLILSHNKTLAGQLYEEFKEFFPNNAVKYFISYYDYYQPEAYLPGKDIYIEKEADINKEIEKYRLASMNAAATRDDAIIIASVSCIYNIGDPENYRNKGFTLSIGQEIEISQLARDLTKLQYQRDLTDFIPGSFRIKGDTVDIFAAYEEYPVRVMFFDNEIEGMYIFDPLTGQKIADLNEIEVFPAKNFVFEKDVIRRAIEEIKVDLQKQYDFLMNIGKNLEAQRLKQRTEYDLEMIEEVGYCKGMENYSRYFEDRREGEPPYTLMDYFPDDYLLIVDESHITLPQVAGMSNGDKARKETLIEHGFRLPSARDNRPLTFHEFRQRQGQTLYASATPAQWEIEDSNKRIVELLTRPTGLLDPEISVRPTEGQVDDLINEIQARVKKKQRTLVTTLTKRMAEDLSDYLQDIGIKVFYLHSDQDAIERTEILRDLRLGKYDVLVGINLLREGLDLPEVSLVAIMDADKEGFLRSKTSLIQTIGRAARHVEGKVILYGDKMTESMKYAVSETQRRRKKQQEYNRKHGITPASIQKAIRESIKKSDEHGEINYADWIKTAKPDPRQVKGLIKDLEAKMFLAAQNLQYEKAAQLRDQIKELKTGL